MKRLLAKYVVLILVTFGISILIYNYVEASTAVDTEADLLTVQKQKEDSYLNNTNFSIDNPNVIVNPYGNSPLTALVIFQTKDLTTVDVTVKAKDGGQDLVHTFMPSKVHILPIYGLYAGYENKILITASGTTKEITIKTDNLPNDFAKVTNLKNNNYKTDEFYFTTPIDKGYTAAYDDKGEVRWYLIGDYKWDIQRLNNGHILISSDKIIKKSYSVGLMEMDLLGKVYYEYVIPGGYHHDAFEMNNGNLLLASNKLGRDTKEDYAVEIDRASGNIVKVIDLYKILPGKKTKDWFKMTSLSYDSKTNSITVSGYNSNMIVNIDYTSLNVNWIIADKNKIDKDYQKYLLKTEGDIDYPEKPQSINLLDNGKMIFVSQKNNKKYLITYQIDYSNQTVKQIDSYKLNSNDDAYLEAKDNDYIVTQGQTISEIQNKDEVVSMNVNSILYNTKKMGLYANDIYYGVQGVRLGTLGESKTIGDYLLLSSKVDNKSLKKYDIKLYKDVFGLKVKGTFKESDRVQIILDNVLDKKTYDLLVPESKSNKEITASRYINEDGIKGKYYIFLNINGKIYKLLKYVIFY